jgi:DNA-binding response OmpR family regulator
VKTILIVEDDERLAFTLSRRLKAEGYRVFEAHDALSGASTALREQPDLVVLDLQMPAGGGFAVAERVQRQIPRAIPLIVVTGLRRDGLLERAMSLGAVAYVEKPYDVHELVAMVRTAVGTGPPASRPAPKGH